MTTLKNQHEDLKAAGLVVAGILLNLLFANIAKLLQLPFYFGVGLSYNDAAPIKFMGFAVGAKLRARFYITDRIGIWGGGSAKFGYGETQVTADMSKSVYQRVLALEAGITFSL